MREILHAAVTAGTTPGGVLAVSDGGRPTEMLPFGRIAFARHGTAVQHPPRVTADTAYDVASLTKPMATAAVLARLVASGAIDLDAAARSLVPELRAPGSERITLRHLAGHAAGLPAHARFYERLRAGDLAGADSPREALARMAAASPLVASPGDTATYSDIGYILLACAIERAAGERIDSLAHRLVFEPVAMTRTGFVNLARPGRDDAAPADAATSAGEFDPAPVAPTEWCPVRGLVWGEVHDDNAHAAGGVAGHAGLFSTAADVSRFGRTFAAAFAGDRGGPFDPDAVRELLSTRAAPETTWRLGWDMPSRRPGVSQAGDLWPRTGFGHLGFTGCSLWIDPPRRRVAVLLTNRVNAGREHPERIRALRRAVMDEVVTRLDRGEPLDK